jgi:hypothetical protein
MILVRNMGIGDSFESKPFLGYTQFADSFLAGGGSRLLSSLDEKPHPYSGDDRSDNHTILRRTSNMDPFQWEWRIAGKLVEFKNNEALILFGDQEVRVNLHDLSLADRAYLLKVQNPAETPKPEAKEDTGGKMVSKEETTEKQVEKMKPQRVVSQKMLDFIKLLTSFPPKYQIAKNQLQKSALRTERAENLKKMFGDRHVTNWTGRIFAMTTNSDRDAVIRLVLDDLEVTHTNLPLVSVPIKHGSKMYQFLASCSADDLVLFSGDFLESNDDYLKEGSITEYGSMTEPVFLFRISEISKIN